MAGSSIKGQGIKRKENEDNLKIYVGNLPYQVTEEELRQEFGSFGEVTSVSIVKDRYSGSPKGFGFVEMPSVSAGQAAIASLNGKTLREQALDVSAARPPSGDRGGRSYGSGRGGRSGGGGGRRY